MQPPGPAQVELIRRYARTLRELQSEALRARGTRAAARERRLRDEAARLARHADQAAADAGGSVVPSAPAS